MKNFVYSGKSITFTATETLVSGQPYALKNAFGVIAASLLPGQSGELFIRGAFRIPKDPAKSVEAGQMLYWDGGNKRLTVATENEKAVKFQPVGIAGDSAKETEKEIVCLLNGVAIEF